MAERLAYLREHTGTANGDRTQVLAQQAARKANSLEERLAELERLTPYSVALATDFTTTLNTAQPTKLRMPVVKGDLWDLEFWTASGCSGDALGMKFAIYAPADSVVAGVLYSSLTGMTDFAVVQITAINTLTTAVHTVNGATRPDYVRARIDVRNNGNVQLYACATTATRTCTVAAKSYMRATRYTAV